MSDLSDSKKMVGGYGSDDKIELETGEEIVDNTNEVGGSQKSNRDQDEPSGPAGSVELGSSATDIDNLSGSATNYTSGGGTSGFGKGS